LCLGVFVVLILGGAARAAIFMYVDDDGRRHAVGSIDAVPPEYRAQIDTVEGAYDDSTEAEREQARAEAAERRAEWMKGQSERLRREQEEAVVREASRERLREDEARKAQGEIEVRLLRNRVYVPVRLTQGSRQKDAYLVLDTGAEGSVIYTELAKSVGMRLDNLTIGSGYGVGGVKIECRRGTLDCLTVGPYEHREFDVGIVDYDGPRVTESGLLGMNFLKGYEHRVDYTRKVLQLTPRQTGKR
jgi:predicted aspartyl protease